MLIEIPRVLSRDEVRQFREILEQSAWEDGRTTAGHVAARAKDNQQLSQDDPQAAKLANFILGRLGATERFIAMALPLKVLPPRFNRYAGGESYGDHIDNAIFGVPSSPLKIRSDLSATLFLSDPEEYDGGELTVHGPFGEHAVKLPAGHMAVYPASTLHRVTPVTRGVRFGAFFWIQSLIREENRRAILLELDDTIRELGTEQPGNQSIVRLTGIYHNLIRDWAIT